jgi:hypothetical protein
MITAAPLVIVGSSWRTMVANAELPATITRPTAIARRRGF